MTVKKLYAALRFRFFASQALLEIPVLNFVCPFKFKPIMQIAYDLNFYNVRHFSTSYIITSLDFDSRRLIYFFHFWDFCL